MEPFIRYARISVLSLFLAAMFYFAYSIYSERRITVIKPLEITELEDITREIIEKLSRELVVLVPMEQASKEVILGQKEPTDDNKNLENSGAGEPPPVVDQRPTLSPSSDNKGTVAEVKMPGFSVSLPESSSWMTIAKMISLVLLTYLGVKTINLGFKKLERYLFGRRTTRA